MLTETEFHTHADQWLALMLDRIEALDESGVLSPELEGSGLSISLPEGKTYLISKHAPSRQLWLASPISGGLHFAYDGGDWRLKDGRTLIEVARAELLQLAGVAL